jgi:DNA helicase-2/ATP-dependent DNA helicase PcrA
VGQSPGEKLIEIFQGELGYKEYLLQNSTDGAIAEKKWVVVEILGRIMDSYMKKRAYDLDTLRSFVDAMMLRDDMEADDNANKVQMMTLHASKGLEYPVVILAGLEEDLLPHKTLGSDIDEERRLFYVGVTRAKKRLIISRCQRRKKHGAVRPVAPSRFLLEIPKQFYKEYENGARPVSGQDREDLVQNFLKKLSEGKAPSKPTN